MSLPSTHKHVLRFMFADAERGAWQVWDSPHNGLQIRTWDAAKAGGPQPTDEQVATASQSPEFADYLAEHGGDPVLTARRKASTAADGRDGYPLRAILRVMMQEMNELRAHVQLLKSELQQVTSHSNQRARLRDDVPNIGNKTFAPFKNKYKNAIEQVDE